MRALISVSDKTGVVEFARALSEMGYELLSTGGTESMLKGAGLEVKNVSDVTGFAECLDGRVKTLHPAIHGGILAKRDSESHMKQLADNDIETIDLLAVNLYPFKQTISKADVQLEEAIENIDIGGPTMLRAAAKNYRHVTVVSDPEDYENVIAALKKGGDELEEFRYNLAAKVFEHTAAYDALIAEFLCKRSDKSEFPNSFTMIFDKVQDLRYGENSHQKAAFYKDAVMGKGLLSNAEQIQGKELSFNNINDAHGAVACLKEFEGEICAVAVKHANPCGVGVGASVFEAYKKAHDCDPISIFGGIVAVNAAIDEQTAKKMSEIFLEIVIAPDFTQAALEIFSAKKNLRVLKIENVAKKLPDDFVDIKRIAGGLLVQESDSGLFEQLKTVTEKEPNEIELEDMIFAMKVVKHTRSNAIVLAKDGMTIGIGPGQTNRIWAVENAIRQSNFDTKGAVMASDAFFPFDDCIGKAAEAGISAVIQPGGSVRDQESIAKADEKGMSMIFSKLRHFKH